MKIRRTVAGLGAGLALSLALQPALAGHRDHSRERWHDSDAHYTYAKVVEVRPIYRTVRVAHPRRECWNERVVHHEYHRESRSKTPMILGGIIGGALGNQMGGSSRGRNVATAAGAILGASVGNDVSRSWNPDRSHHHTYEDVERVCETVRDYTEEREVDAYDVTYRYQGELYHTVTDYHPGKRIRIAVSVHPVH